MTKISALGTDSSPTLTDYVPTVDTETTTTKRTLLSAILTLFFSNVPSDLKNGWITVTGTWTYSSWDSTNKTGVITVPTDATTVYSAGMKIRISQATGGTKYGIITKVAATALTVYFGTDYTLNNETVSSPFYSIEKAPFGFPLDPLKWTVSVTSTNQRTTTSTTYTTFTDAITVPIGAWFLSIKGTVSCSPASDPASARYSLISLSDVALSGSTVTYDDLTCDVGCKIGATATNPVCRAMVYAQLRIAITIATTYTMYGRSSAGSPTTTTNLEGSTNTTVFKAQCAYL